MEFDVRMLLAEPFDRFARAGGDVDGARAPGAYHLEADDLLAVEHGEFALLGSLVTHFGNRVEPHGAAVADRNGQCREFLGG